MYPQTWWARFKAHFKQMFHCAWHLHRPVTTTVPEFHSSGEETVDISCECDKVFWRADHYGTTDDF